MGDKLGHIVCSFGKEGCECTEVVNTYNPYARYIGAGIAIAIVVAIGILVIYLIKRKSKKKENTQEDNL